MLVEGKLPRLLPAQHFERERGLLAAIKNATQLFCLAGVPERLENQRNTIVCTYHCSVPIYLIILYLNHPFHPDHQAGVKTHRQG